MSSTHYLRFKGYLLSLHLAKVLNKPFTLYTTAMNALKCLDLIQTVSQEHGNMYDFISEAALMMDVLKYDTLKLDTDEDAQKLVPIFDEKFNGKLYAEIALEMLEKSAEIQEKVMGESLKGKRIRDLKDLVSLRNRNAGKLNKKKNKK